MEREQVCFPRCGPPSCEPGFGTDDFIARNRYELRRSNRRLGHPFASLISIRRTKSGTGRRQA